MIPILFVGFALAFQAATGVALISSASGLEEDTCSRASDAEELGHLLLDDADSTTKAPRGRTRHESIISIVLRNLTPRSFLLLSIPAAFDLIATFLTNLALLYITASLSSLLRATTIIFTALAKVLVLRQRLSVTQWAGVLVLSVAMCVGSLSVVLNNSLLAPGDNGAMPSSRPQKASNESFSLAAQRGPTASPDNGSGSDSGATLLGIALVVVGAVVQALEFIAIEHLMSESSASEESDVDSGAGGVGSGAGLHPLAALVGQGFFGSLLCLAVVFPLAATIPGDDNGCQESLYDSLVMLSNSPALLGATVGFTINVGFFNVASNYITSMLDALWNSIMTK